MASAPAVSPEIAERWRRLKANAEEELRSAAERAAVQQSRRERSEPLFDADVIAPEDAESLPIETTEPDWVRTAQPLPDDPDAAETPESDPPRVATAAHVSPTIILPLLSLQDPRRQVRTMSEISPHYDVAVDKEIREYAVKQAEQYGVKFGDEPYSPRVYPGTVFAWEAPNLWHYPLYFEDPALERYGHTYPHVVQPFVSIGRFSTQLIGLPYQMTIDPPCECMYTLGWYRPGDCAPKLHYRIPWSLRAAAVEAGVITGLAIIIP